MIETLEFIRSVIILGCGAIAASIILGNIIDGISGR